VEQDDLPTPRGSDNDDDESFTGQVGLIFGAVIIVALLFAVGAFFALGGMHAIHWLLSRL